MTADGGFMLPERTLDEDLQPDLDLGTCPWLNGTGICRTGCQTEPACQTGRSDEGWPSEQYWLRDDVDLMFMQWVNDLLAHHGDKPVRDVLGSPAILSALTGDWGQFARTYAQRYAKQHVDDIEYIDCCAHCGCPEGKREGHDDVCRHGCGDGRPVLA